MLRPLIIALALGACDQVFSIKEVQPVDSTVNGTFRFRTVVNNAMFEPTLVQEVLAPGTFDFDAYLDDGTPSPITYREDGSFTFAIAYPGQRYRLVYEVDGVVTEYQHTVPNISLGTQVAGRRDRRPISASQVTFNYPNNLVLGVLNAFVASTGLYSLTNTAMRSASINFDWRLSNFGGAALSGMLDASDHDRLYGLEFRTVADTPEWHRITGVTSAAVTQATNSSFMLPQMQAVAPNTCMKLSIKADAERLRISSNHPRGYHRNAQDWHAFMTPAPNHVGMPGALFAAFSSFDNARDLEITRAFHNPFPGMTVVAQSGVLQYFYMQLSPANAIEVANTTRTYVIPNTSDPACTAVPATLEPDIAMIGKFELEDVELDSDNVAVVVDGSRPVVLSWEEIAPGPHDNTTVTLHELQNVNNVTTLISKWAASVPDDRAIFDPALFEPGHTYAFQVTAGRGRPNVASGDYLTIELPLHNSTVWTRQFVVRAPD